MSNILKVALFGPMKSGKTTLAGMLSNEFQTAPLNNSLRLKQIVAMLNDEPMSRMDNQDFKDEVSPNNYGKTNREMMTMIGTDLIRKQHNNDQWADIIKRQVKFVDKAGVHGLSTLNMIDVTINLLLDSRHKVLNSDGGLLTIKGILEDAMNEAEFIEPETDAVMWLRSDDRYPNESLVSKEAGFLMIYVDRKLARIKDNSKVHDSELHYEELKGMADFVLSNDGPIESTYQSLVAIIKSQFGLKTVTKCGQLV